MNNKDYQEIANKHSKSSPCFTNCLKAFFFGGTICMLGEAIAQLCLRLGTAKSDALLYASLTLIFIAGLLTGIGIFDKIARGVNPQFFIIRFVHYIQSNIFLTLP